MRGELLLSLDPEHTAEAEQEIHPDLDRPQPGRKLVDDRAVETAHRLTSSH